MDADLALAALQPSDDDSMDASEEPVLPADSIPEDAMDASDDVRASSQSDAAMALDLQGAELAKSMADASIPATGAARVSGIGLEGLPNIGDSCYMGAVLVPLFGRVERFEPLDPDVRDAFHAVRAAVGRDARIQALHELRATFADAEQEDAADFARFVAQPYDFDGSGELDILDFKAAQDAIIRSTTPSIGSDPTWQRYLATQSQDD
jgi:hypothetical protein